MITTFMLAHTHKTQINEDSHPDAAEFENSSWVRPKIQKDAACTGVLTKLGKFAQHQSQSKK